jgi:hypothetical protein
MSDSEEKLKGALQRLQVSTQKIITTRGYTGEAKSLKALEEIIREQLLNANTRSTTRTIR